MITEMVRNEAKGYNWIKHPNAIRCYEMKESCYWVKKDGREIECAILVLEFIGGGELFYYIKT